MLENYFLLADIISFLGIPHAVCCLSAECAAKPNEVLRRFLAVGRVGKLEFLLEHPGTGSWLLEVILELGSSCLESVEGTGVLEERTGWSLGAGVLEGWMEWSLVAEDGKSGVF